MFGYRPAMKVEIYIKSGWSRWWKCTTRAGLGPKLCIITT